MASPRYVYPWWGRNMVNDPEKHMYYTIQLRNMIPGRTDQTRGKKRERSKAVEETFTPSHTYPSTNMQVRVMTQLPFEAFNAWTCIDMIQACSDKE